MTQKDKFKKFFEQNFKFDPLYFPALIKLGAELSGSNDQKLDEILEDTLSEFSLSKEDLESFIKKHKDELIKEAKRLVA